MHKRLSLTLDFEAYNLLKRKRINISKYVERLVYKDVAKAQKSLVSQSVGSNPAGPIFYRLSQVRCLDLIVVVEPQSKKCQCTTHTLKSAKPF